MLSWRNDLFHTATGPYNDPLFPSNYKPTSDQNGSFEDNMEEERVITNTDVYAKGLVNNKMKNLMKEDIEGIPITITFRFWPLKKKEAYTFGVWKRTYHRLKDFDTMGEEDYVYKYLLK